MISRRSIYFRQEELRRRLERTLRVRVGRELRFTARNAARLYPHWEPSIAAHAMRMYGILENFYVVALRLSGKEIAKAAFKAGYSEEVAFKAKIDNLGRDQVKWARDNAAKKVGEITKTTRDKIAAAIARGVEKAEGDSATAKMILRRTGGSITNSRALMIARTESHSAAQAGGLIAAQSLGVVQTKEWIAAEDERTRDSHADADGQVVDIDDNFSVGGTSLSFPGDPDGPAEEVINCRCVMKYGIHAAESQLQDAT